MKRRSGMNWSGMNRVRLLAAWALVVVAGAVTSAQEAKAFYGEISDSQCALNVHSLTRSHQEMLKSKSMGGTARECALYCVKYHGGDFVLSTKKDVYRLDDQTIAGTFAGRNVRITGEMDPDHKTIHVLKIEEDH